jgi:hypothetical protein
MLAARARKVCKDTGDQAGREGGVSKSLWALTVTAEQTYTWGCC